MSLVSTGFLQKKVKSDLKDILYSITGLIEAYGKIRNDYIIEVNMFG